MNSIHNLPAELLEIIFDYLTFEERQEYRRVCKLWKYLIDKLYSNNKSGILLSEKEFYVNTKKWFIDDYKLKDEQLFLKVYFIDKLFTKSTKILLNKLKRLIYYPTFDYEKDNKLSIKLFKLLNLEQFNQLERLQIEKMGTADNYNEFVHLNLPNLEWLSIKNFKLIQLILDTPKLINLCLLDLNDDLEIKLNYTNNIKYVETSLVNLPFKSLINLEILYLLAEDFDYDEENGLLIDLINLKEIHIYNLFELLLYLFEEKEKLNRTNLKLFLNGLYLNDIDDYHKLCSLEDKSFMELYVSKKFTMSNNLPTIKCTSYSSLENNSIELNKEIINKFKNLEVLIVKDDVKNEIQLEQLINSYQYFTSILFNNCHLSNNFYNKLPNFKYLSHLYLIDQFTKNDFNEFDLNCILNCKYLESLKIDKELPLDFVRKIHTNLEYFHGIDFKFKNHDCIILTFCLEDIDDVLKFKYQLTIDKDNIHKFVNLDELIDYMSLNIDE